MKQRMRRISALLLVVLMCVSMVVPAFAADDADCPERHTKSNCDAKPIDTHEASCGEQGYTTYQCGDCGDYFADDFVDSLGDHVVQMVQQDPTCTEDGFVKEVCLNCGKEEVVDADENPELEATGHEWALLGETCEDGMVCTVCGETKDEVDDNLHDWWGDPDLKDDPTHDEDGVVVPGSAVLTCSTCGKKKTVTVLCDGEHMWQIDEKEEPTCTAVGHQAGQVCLICDATRNYDGSTYNAETDEYAPYEEIAKVPCAPAEGWVVELPTCTAPGSAYKVCTMCRKTVGAPTTLNPLGHNYETKIYVEVETGGLTANQIAAFNALATGVTAGTAYELDILVENADGTISTVKGACVAPVTLDLEAYEDDAKLPAATTADVTAGAGEKCYVWSGEYQDDDPIAGGWIHWGENCTTETSFYTYVCTKCGVEEATVNVTGHYWSAPVITPPVCETETDGSKVYTCLNPNCSGATAEEIEDTEDGIDENAAGKATKTETIEAKHNHVAVTVEPTCIAGGYTWDVCTLCGDVDKTVEGADADGKYNILPKDETAHEEADRWISGFEVNCNEDGKKQVYCTICDKVLQASVVVEALGHDLDTTVFAKPSTAASCEAPGYNYYNCKRENCPDKVVAVEVATQLSHTFTEVETKLPSCAEPTVDGYSIVYCKHCHTPQEPMKDEDGNPVKDADGNLIGTQINPTKYNPANKDHHNVKEITGERVHGNCTTKDTVYYQCITCDGEDLPSDVEYPWVEEEVCDQGHGEGHDLEKVAAVKATCFSDGNIEYYRCKTEGCGYLTTKSTDTMGTEGITLASTVTKKLTEDGACDLEKLVPIKAKAPTCAEDGNTEGAKCSVCNTLYGATKIDKLNHTYDGTESAWIWLDSRTASCELWGYTYYECDVCGEEKMTDYVADFGGHKLETVEKTEPTCYSVGWSEYQYCTVCYERPVEAEMIAKLPHKNEAGEEFYGICTDTVEDRECVNKGCYVDYTDRTEDIVKEDGTVLEEDTVYGHSWISTYVDATCMSYSYTLVVCEHCDYSYMEGEGFEYASEHIFWGDWEVVEPASTTQNGLKVRECDCGAIEEEVIPALAGLGFEIEVENDVYADALIADTGRVKVTLKTLASNLDVWGFRITLNYTDTLTIGSTLTVLNEAFEKVEVTAGNGKIVVMAYAPNDADGNVGTVTLDGEEALLSFTLTVPADVAVGTEYTVGAGTLFEVVDTENNQIALTAPANATFRVGANIYDVVADGNAHINDAEALRTYVTGEAEEEYNSAADVNQDGEVNAADFAAIVNYLKTGVV